jgi:hypothetical protein
MWTASARNHCPSVELPAGTLIQGTPYTALYNSSDSTLYLQSFFSDPYSVPIGGFLPYVGSTPPNRAQRRSTPQQRQPPQALPQQASPSITRWRAVAENKTMFNRRSRLTTSCGSFKSVGIAAIPKRESFCPRLPGGRIGNHGVRRDRICSEAPYRGSRKANIGRLAT